MVFSAAQTNLRLKENSLVPELLQTNMDQIFLLIDTCGFPIMHLYLHESDLCRSFSTSLQDKTKPKRKPPNRSRPTKQIKKDGGKEKQKEKNFTEELLCSFSFYFFHLHLEVLFAVSHSSGSKSLSSVTPSAMGSLNFPAIV